MGSQRPFAGIKACNIQFVRLQYPLSGFLPIIFLPPSLSSLATSRNRTNKKAGSIAPPFHCQTKLDLMQQTLQQTIQLMYKRRRIIQLAAFA